MKDLSKTYYHKGHKLRGWFNSNKENWYKNLVSNVKNGKIIEIGVYGGASILSIADLCIKNNVQVIGIDPWDTIELYNEKTLKPQELKGYRKIMKGHFDNLTKIIDAEKYNHITLVKDFSLNAVTEILDNSIELIYIDANHSYTEVLKDIQAWYPKVKKGGILCGDDFAWEGVKKAVNHFVKSQNLTYKNTKDSWVITK